MKQLGNVVGMSKDAKATMDVVSHDVQPLEVATDAGKYARVGWLVVLVGVVGFMLWAFLAPLDKGVPVSGTVTVSGNRKAIQHQSGGTVQDILVKEGDIVGNLVITVPGMSKNVEIPVAAGASVEKLGLFGRAMLGLRGPETDEPEHDPKEAAPKGE